MKNHTNDTHEQHDAAIVEATESALDTTETTDTTTGRMAYIARANELSTPPVYGRIAGKKGQKRMTASLGTVIVRLPILGTTDYADLTLFASLQGPSERPEAALDTATVAVDLPTNLAFPDHGTLAVDVLEAAESALYSAPWFKAASVNAIAAIRKGLAPANAANTGAKPVVRRSLASVV